jgi:class 3 adenylate cyclase
MFCDPADSTQLAQQLDPEDLREVIRAYQATAAAVIHQLAATSRSIPATGGWCILAGR